MSINNTPLHPTGVPQDNGQQQAASQPASSPPYGPPLHGPEPRSTPGMRTVPPRNGLSFAPPPVFVAAEPNETLRYVRDLTPPALQKDKLVSAIRIALKRDHHGRNGELIRKGYRTRHDANTALASIAHALGVGDRIRAGARVRGCTDGRSA